MALYASSYYGHLPLVRDHAQNSCCAFLDSFLCPHRICNAGFLKSGGSCVRCGTGTYSAAAGATVCSPCTNKPASNTYYLARLAINIPDDNDCPW